MTPLPIFAMHPGARVRHKARTERYLFWVVWSWLDYKAATFRQRYYYQEPPIECIEIELGFYQIERLPG